MNITHYKIFEYWKDKTFGEILENGNKEFIVWDWGEPSCWACGKHAIRHAESEEALIDKFTDEHGDTDFEKIWNNKEVKASLERCHIIPHALGGEDEPRNLFLLCKDCHFLSPDTDNPDSFFRWVVRRRKEYFEGLISPYKILEDIDKELQERGYKPLRELYSQIDEIELDWKELKDYASKHTGLHFNKFVYSSLVSVATDWLIQKIYRLSHTDFSSKSKQEKPKVVCWEIDGSTLPATEWCKKYNKIYSNICRRIERCNLTPKQALTFPPVPRDYRKKPREYWELIGAFAE